MLPSQQLDQEKNQRASNPVKELTGGRKRVDLRDGFVPADADDSGKAEGQAGIVARAFSDGIEGDFENHERLDFEAIAFFGNGGREEFVGEFGDLGVGESGVGFSQSDELAGRFIAEGEGVVA